MGKESLQLLINLLKEKIGSESYVRVKEFSIGRGIGVCAAIIYFDTIVNKDIINRDILGALMQNVEKDLSDIENKAQYLCERYIFSGSTLVEPNIDKAVEEIKNGNTILIVDSASEFIIIDTANAPHRPIGDPINEVSIQGSREGFVENIDINLSIFKRKIKDKNLAVKRFTVGARSQTSLAVLYIADVVDQNMLQDVLTKLQSIDVDYVSSTGMLAQYIEKNTYSIFPQTLQTERADRASANVMEGRIAIVVDGNSAVMTVPALLNEFYQTADDYSNRTIVASILRMLRVFAILTVLFLPSLYLTLLKFNSELIPVNFIVPIVQARSEISLTPFFEILSMELLVELLREGGLRLPSKIAPTLSIVGGIIIGDAAVQSKMVSPTTLLLVGITVVSSFLIPNYEMSISVRVLRFAILIITNLMGMFGISACLTFLLIHLSSMDSFGVNYMTFYKSDMKDIFTRAPLWQMNKRPAEIANNNPIRQSPLGRKKNGTKGK